MPRKPKPPTRGELVIAFITEFCKTPEGAKVGRPIELAPFQKRFIKEIYDNPAGTRRAIMSIARKNGKSAVIAALLLAHICGPEAVLNSQIVSGAMSRDQAALIFSLASKMIALDERLQAVTRIVPSSKRIIGLRRNVEYRALAADGTTAHGLSPILAILDEVGQIRGPMTPFVEAIVTSQGAHEAPLLIAISTSAPSDADMFSLWIDDARRSGDPHTVCHVYEADRDCALTDRAQWKKANPALGLFRSERDLEEQLKMAARIPSMEAGARNLLLNQRVALESLWLAPAVWKTCAAKPDLEVLRSAGILALGLDLSTRVDLTAAVLAAKDAESGEIHLLPFVFAPENGVREREARDKAPYSAWAKSGDLFLCPGNTLDYDWIFAFLRDRFEDLGLFVHTIAFDRWRITEAKAAANRVGFSANQWSEVGQGFASMSPRVEYFETALLQGKIRHGGHPLLNMAAANAVVVQDAARNSKLDKAKSTLRIDPLVAAVMATGVLMEFAEFDVGLFVASLAALSVSCLLGVTLMYNPSVLII